MVPWEREMARYHKRGWERIIIDVSMMEDREDYEMEWDGDGRVRW